MQHICSGCSFLRTWFIADYEVTDPSHSNDHQYFTTRTWFIADYEVTDPSHSNDHQYFTTRTCFIADYEVTDPSHCNDHQYFTTRTWFIADYEVTDPSHSNNHQYFKRHPCKVCPVLFKRDQAGVRQWFPSSGAKWQQRKVRQTVLLTHWSLGDLEAIFKIQIPVLFYW